MTTFLKLPQIDTFNSTMYKHQISTILSLDFKTKSQFRGVFAMDKLPTRKKGCYVINTDDHDEPGSHWVAVFDDGENVEYMDSYGHPPLDARCLNFLGDTFSFNTVRLQQQYSNACGFYCVYFLLHRSRTLTANYIISMLARSDSGYIVKNFLYSRYKQIFK